MLRRGLLLLIITSLVLAACTGCLTRTSQGSYVSLYCATMSSALEDQRYAVTSMLEAIDSYVDGTIGAQEVLGYIASSQAKFVGAHAVMTGLMAPDGLKLSHRQYTDAAEQYVVCTQTFAAAISGQDPAKVSQGYEVLAQANEGTKKAIQLAQQHR